MSYCIDLSGKVVLVTGGYAGIGLSITKTQLSAGARVIILGKTGDKFLAVKDELMGISNNFDFYELDIKNSKDVTDVIQQIMKKEPKIDVLVNNAGIVRDALIIRMSDEDWLEVMDVNLNGLFYVTKNVLKYMIKAKNGRIINISSVIGKTGNIGQSNYAATKAGIIAFTKSIAREYASRGIIANAVSPGFIKSSMTDKLPENIKDGIKKGIPLDRIGDPADVSNAVLFLSSGLSDYITGSVIDVNGGMSM